MDELAGFEFVEELEPLEVGPGVAQHVDGAPGCEAADGLRGCRQLVAGDGVAVGGQFSAEFGAGFDAGQDGEQDVAVVAEPEVEGAQQRRTGDDLAVVLPAGGADGEVDGCGAVQFAHGVDLGDQGAGALPGGSQGLGLAHEVRQLGRVLGVQLREPAGMRVCQVESQFPRGFVGGFDHVGQFRAPVVDAGLDRCGLVSACGVVARRFVRRVFLTS